MLPVKSELVKKFALVGHRRALRARRSLLSLTSSLSLIVIVVPADKLCSVAKQCGPVSCVYNSDIIYLLIIIKKIAIQNIRLIRNFKKVFLVSLMNDYFITITVQY